MNNCYTLLLILQNVSTVPLVTTECGQDEPEGPAGHRAGAGGLHVQRHLPGADDPGGPRGGQPHHLLPVPSHRSRGSGVHDQVPHGAAQGALHRLDHARRHVLSRQVVRILDP